MVVSYPNPTDRRRAYVHRCDEDTFVEVAHALDDASGGVTLPELVEALDIPFTQASVALEFLKERGVAVHVAGGGRRWFASSLAAYEDAMVEWTVLRDGHAALPATSSM
jgi:hypothetical protein